MMTSNVLNKEAYVWLWLPGATTPVVAGKIETDGKQVVFNYGKTYLERENKISIYAKELPLRLGRLPLLDGLSMPNCIRDASPDAWGRRVLMNRTFGRKSAGVDTAQMDEITYLLESGSDRIGALDFQHSPTEYIPRYSVNVSLDELLESAKRVEQGAPLSPELDQALHHGSSIGGARPKALIESDDKKYVAKFSASSDIYNVVKAEFVAMRLAKLAGLNVADVSLTKSSHKDVLLIERFDRVKHSDGWERKCMVSALTLFELDELMARYASYEKLAEIIRYNFRDASKTLRELFSRLVFNILVGNTDDHARNHAAFWDGEMLSLTPAYDICPQNRAGNEATQAMLISGSERMSKLSCCVEAAHHFLLSREDACQLIAQHQEIIEENWLIVCDEAELSTVERAYLWQRQILNPFSFEGIQ
jgi:serine/threonine-protein kinase HipA